MQKLINVSSGVYYGQYTNRTFIDFIDLSKNNELMNAKPIASRNMVDAPKTMYLASPTRPTFLPKKSARKSGKSAYTAPNIPTWAGVAPISSAR